MQDAIATHAEQTKDVDSEGAKAIASGSSHGNGYRRDLSFPFRDALEATAHRLKYRSRNAKQWDLARVSYGFPLASTTI